jgi:hypothetical protein
LPAQYLYLPAVPSQYLICGAASKTPFSRIIIILPIILLLFTLVTLHSKHLLSNTSHSIFTLHLLPIHPTIYAGLAFNRAPSGFLASSYWINLAYSAIPHLNISLSLRSSFPQDFPQSISGKKPLSHLSYPFSHRSVPSLVNCWIAFLIAR